MPGTWPGGQPSAWPGQPGPGGFQAAPAAPALSGFAIDAGADAGEGAVDIFGDPAARPAAGAAAPLDHMGDASAAFGTLGLGAGGTDAAGNLTRSPVYRPGKQTNQLRMIIGVVISGVLGVVAAVGLFYGYQALKGSGTPSTPTNNSTSTPNAGKTTPVKTEKVAKKKAGLWGDLDAPATKEEEKKDKK
jgi:hypothetical protein